MPVALSVRPMVWRWWRRVFCRAGGWAASGRGCLNGTLGGFSGWAGIDGREQDWVGGVELDAWAGTRPALTERVRG